MLWCRGDPFDDHLDFCSEAIGKFRIAGTVPMSASISSARAAGPKTTYSAVNAGVEARP
jgi:hypothetical protein